MTARRPPGPVFRSNGDNPLEFDVFDMCDCPRPLMMGWHVDGEWVAVYEIADTRNVDADAAEYKARCANAWMIGCPDCGRVYARGW